MKKIYDSSGSVMMEVVLCFPVVLALVFGGLQIAHILMAKQVVNYAAYAAVRATLVTAESEQPQTAALNAASHICVWLTLSPDDNNNGVLMPKLSDLGEKLQVTIKSDQWIQVAEVTFDFPLIMPVAGPIIGWGMNIPAYDFEKKHQDMTGDKYSNEPMNYPYIRFKERMVLPKPYKIVL